MYNFEFDIFNKKKKKRIRFYNNPRNIVVFDITNSRSNDTVRIKARVSATDRETPVYRRHKDRIRIRPFETGRACKTDQRRITEREPVGWPGLGYMEMCDRNIENSNEKKKRKE